MSLLRRFLSAWLLGQCVGFPPLARSLPPAPRAAARPRPGVLRAARAQMTAAEAAPPASPAKPSLHLPSLKPSRIRKGDFVVHQDYGIGRFEGLHQMQQSVQTADGTWVPEKALRVKFKDGMLDVPLASKGDIKLFKRREEVGELEVVRLDGIRSRKTWQNRKAKAAKNVMKVASELLRLYAERQELSRPPCPADGAEMEEFARQFQYEPTADQLKCFRDVAADMCNSSRPMDRLVCGDVGFGKTEVAMRAVFRMVASGRQVAFLAPTTVLAAQHLRVLRARMPGVRIELISSIVKRKPQELRQVHEDISAGLVQVVVGTHALLSNKVAFRNLGLFVVDEEQRFGVAQKEKIKQATKSVDVLTLSATPIPRTMYMCMAGIRDMSTLETPPSGRQAVVTKVCERNDAEVVRAIEFELARNGQVFYVVPRIEMIDTELDFITAMVPSARVSYACGGLKDLEKRITDFALGEIDVMVSTTIMENGIDIPNVNTIVIQQTHMFGLAQLHQLRGRVGRSSARAYAYLMHPPVGQLTEDAHRRLRVLQRDSALGCGRSLAESDLQIRGAGNIFGSEQKGNPGVRDLGVDMYLQILQKAMKYLQARDALGLEASDDDSELLQEVAAAVDETQLLGLDHSLDMV
ncbi:hypothetical protein AB1Y20_022149 [Prymnesium parvum]|uniref:ATP-dependent DNA helicase RecG n=1 Tax=Prymnesium parvum TaxID=97485 RepID=A0AB34JHY5_PRYPA